MNTPRRLRILVLAGGWPLQTQETEAADVVLYEILRCLAGCSDLDLCFQVIGRPDRPLHSPIQAHLDSLSHAGIRFLDPLVVPFPAWPGKLSLCAAMVHGRPETLIQGAGLHGVLADTLEKAKPDLVLTVWNEYANAIAAGLDVPVVAYYGDAEPIVNQAILDLDRRAGDRGLVDTLRSIWRSMILWAFARAHFTLMRRLASVDTVSANIADYYRGHGVRARYVPNLWRAEAAPDWSTRRDRLEQTAPLKIIGSLGSLRQTANSYGLEVLCREVVPSLRKRMGAGNFEVHVFGRGEPYAHVRALLSDPDLRVRGFVDNIDDEILSAPVFLVPNNHGWFRVGHTRFLHAWSLGACVVAFRGSVDAMPEIEDGKNALIADTPEQMAALAMEAGRDASLRRRIAQGGVETLKARFRPEAVVAELAKDIRSAVRH